MFSHVTPVRPPRHTSDAFALKSVRTQLEESGYPLDRPVVITGSFIPVSEEEALRIMWRARQHGWDAGHYNPRCTCKDNPTGGPHLLIGDLFLLEEFTEERIQALRSLSPERLVEWYALPMEPPRPSLGDSFLDSLMMELEGVLGKPQLLNLKDLPSGVMRSSKEFPN